MAACQGNLRWPINAAILWSWWFVWWRNITQKRSEGSASREQYAKVNKAIKEGFTGKMAFHKSQSEGREGPQQALGREGGEFQAEWTTCAKTARCGLWGTQASKVRDQRATERRAQWGPGSKGRRAGWILQGARKFPKPQHTNNPREFPKGLRFHNSSSDWMIQPFCSSCISQPQSLHLPVGSASLRVPGKAERGRSERGWDGVRSRWRSCRPCDLSCSRHTGCFH